jgi:hypothetical protein
LQAIPPNSYLLLGWLAALALACGTSQTSGPVPTSAAGMAGAVQAGSSTVETSGSGGGGDGGSAGAISGGAAGAVSMAGASGMLGGTGGAAAAGAAGDSGAGGSAAMTCPASAAFCEDFEAYASAQDLSPTWSTSVTGGMLAVDDSKPFAGKRALHMSGPAGMAHSELIVKQGAPLFPLLGSGYFGRAEMWLMSVPTGGVHVNYVQSSGMLPASTQVAKYGWGSMFGKLLAGYTIRATEQNAPVTDCSKPATSTLPTGRWVCVEWQFDGVEPGMHLWFDGTEVSDAAVSKTGTQCATGAAPGGVWRAPTFANLSLGFAQYQVWSNPTEMWLDNVALGPERIGCPQP